MSSQSDKIDFSTSAEATLTSRKDASLASLMWKHPSVFWGGLLLAIMVLATSCKNY